MFESFWSELLNNTSPCKRYLKHGETLIMCKQKDENILKVIEVISLNPYDANRTAKFLCKLADKYEITITGEANPFIIGPSITKNDTFVTGMPIEKLLKWYKYYGFESHLEENGKYTVIRRANGHQSC